MQAACRRGPGLGGGGGACAERTFNMLFMDVTLEVLQPEMSALKLLMPWKSPDMSVMEETSQ